MRLERRLRAFAGVLGTLGAAARGLGAACIVACGLLAAGQPPAFAQAHGVEVPLLRLERADDGLYLSATLGFELPPLVEDALYKGIPVFFVAEADVLRDRWYWSDQRVANAVRYIRLAFQPLTRRWRLNVSPTPIGNAGLGVALSQNFEELPEALASIQRLARWRIADLHDVEADGRYSVEFRFRLDTSQLPRPLQMGVISRSDWSLSTERSLRLLPDGD
ncbi:DUF4390 domain-containing protein [Xylophilus ampelinus]|uniref:Uncharacterized protein DUF4390 n=1 Tax=Xylophilus ampelinus TaxID=54067 RepID=A0A318SYK3_9BURK|nr:DUF4390 domain-containing protein [Xylophilus ampelinus]MCS4510278.1 DUF4390 domain-containing protein [Xylophilus ampelinus]PYE78101.1 uncharacterized protein DUF4390 [Xylophilus ampelinus]